MPLITSSSDSTYTPPAQQTPTCCHYNARVLYKWISYRRYSFSSACLYWVIHVVACVSSALLVTAPEWDSEVCVQCSIFSHCPLVKNFSPSFWLLKAKLLWTFMYNIYMNICFLYTSVNTWGGMQDCMLGVCLSVWKTVFQSVLLLYMLEDVSLHPHQYSVW